MSTWLGYSTLSKCCCGGVSVNIINIHSQLTLSQGGSEVGPTQSVEGPKSKNWDFLEKKFCFKTRILPEFPAYEFQTCQVSQSQNPVKKINLCIYSVYIVVHSLSHVQLFATPWMQHSRLPCPLPFPGVCSDSCPLMMPYMDVHLYISYSLVLSLWGTLVIPSQLAFHIPDSIHLSCGFLDLNLNFQSPHLIHT